MKHGFRKAAILPKPHVRCSGAAQSELKSWAVAVHILSLNQGYDAWD